MHYHQRPTLFALAFSLLAACEKAPHAQAVSAPAPPGQPDQDPYTYGALELTPTPPGQPKQYTFGPCWSSEVAADLWCNEYMQKICGVYGKKAAFLHSVRVHWPDRKKPPSAARPDSND